MRMKNHILPRLVIGISIFLLLSPLSSAISVKSHDRKSKHKSEEQDKIIHQEESSEQISAREGIHSEDDDHSFLDSTLDSKELVKRAQNVSETKSTGKSRKKEKEHSPPSIDVIPPSELGVEDNSEEDGKADLNRESRGDKNPRLYYDDTAPRFPHHSSEGESPFEHTAPEAKQKEGKLYFPKNYVSNKYSPGSKRGHRPSLTGTSGKRIPDHVHFDEGGHPAHEYTSGHGHSHHHPVIGHHEEHEIGPADDSPYTHNIEEHTVKGHHHGHHVSGYGYNHHHGSYRHTLGDKVDAVGKALQVLIPSALLITGVSALFPNRVHVPTTPNKYRQKRSVFRRRSERGMGPPLPLMALPAAHIPPEMEDIPSHILRAEHRIMDGSPAEMYTEYGKRYGTSSENTGFDPFKVFKGPGPETSVNRIQNTIPMLFPNLPDMSQSNERANEYAQGFHAVHFNEGDSPPMTSYSPGPPSPEMVPPNAHTPQRIVAQISPTTSNLGEDFGGENNVDQRRQNILYRRKTTRKPPVFIKETPKIPVQHSSESQKSQYLVKNVKNTLDDSKQVNQDKAEQEFMSSLQNLVTPDVAKAIVENKKEPPKEVDLSPDGPVMGLLTSYAQHENDTPSCQKRALCELAVKGKNPKSTKFEAFLWSVATLVPDVFSEMYDLQEVFQAIRNERCIRFECSNPNLDLQM